MMRLVPVLVLAFAACLSLSGCDRQRPAAAAPSSSSAARTTGAPTPAAPPARAVKVVVAAPVTMARTVSATGTLAADDQVVLGTKVPGRLASIAVDLGTRVRKGMPVATIDPGDYQHRLDQAAAALQQARARLGLAPDSADDRVNTEETSIVRQARALLEEAKLTHDRMLKLLEQQLVARSSVDAAVASLQVAEGRYQDALEEVRNRQALLVQRRSEVDLARQQLADTVIVSPTDGAVAEKKAAVGEYLAPGAPVATILRVHPLRLRLFVPEREAASVRAGQTVKVTLEGDLGVHQGRVVRLSPSIAEGNRTLLVEAEIPNERGVLRPGAFSRAEIVTQAEDRAVMVPRSAIVTFAGIERVITVKDGKTAETRVQTGRRVGESVEIVSGLSGGELIVPAPGNLTGGQTVTVLH